MTAELTLLEMEEKSLATACAYCTVITDDKGQTFICTGGCSQRVNQPLPEEPYISHKAKKSLNIKEEQKQ